MSNVLPAAPNRFYLPFGIFENQPDPGPEMDLKMVATAVHALIPTFESVQECLDARLPEYEAEDVQVIRLDLQADDTTRDIYVGVTKAGAGTLEYRTSSLMGMFRFIGIEPFKTIEEMEKKVAEMEQLPFSERGLPAKFESRGQSVASRPVVVTVSFVDNRVLN